MPAVSNTSKILVIGDEPSDFICSLFKDLGTRYKLDIHLLEFRKIKEKLVINEIFITSIVLKKDIERAVSKFGTKR